MRYLTPNRILAGIVTMGVLGWGLLIYGIETVEINPQHVNRVKRLGEMDGKPGLSQLELKAIFFRAKAEIPDKTPLRLENLNAYEMKRAADSYDSDR